MKSTLALIALFALSGCATVSQMNAESQYGLYKDRDFRVKVVSNDEDDSGILFKSMAARGKEAIQKSAESTGLRYSDFVIPGNRLAAVRSLSNGIEVNKATPSWVVQFNPGVMQLETGDVVVTKISPAFFDLSNRTYVHPGDIPLVTAVVCKARDTQCLADPKRGGTFGVIRKDGTAINGNSQFFGRLDNTVYE